MPSFEPSGDPVTSRRGFFWVGVERVDGPWGTVARAHVRRVGGARRGHAEPYPLVLIHGGGGQGLDWKGTLDGRPGWSTLLVQRGYAVYVVDRPGHGRSSFHRDVIGPMGPPFPFQAGEAIFRSPAEGPASHPTAHLHTQWPGTREDDDPSLKAIVAIEAIGPPFVERPELGLSLEWGITAAPITVDPPAATAAELGGAPRRLPNLAGIPIAVVSAEASPFVHFHDEMVGFLRGAGCDVESLRLADHGVHGNGHGMMFEANNVEALEPIARRVEAKAAA